MLLKHISFSLVVMTALASLTACSTTRYKRFEGVREGMDKAEVLEAAGGPDQKSRWHGKDRWIYVLGDAPQGTEVREVHFEKGRATYVGAKVRPELSAEEQDRLNSEQDKREEEQQAAQEQAAVAAKASAPKDRIDLYIEENLYGNQDPSAEKKKRAPVFEPVD